MMNMKSARFTIIGLLSGIVLSISGIAFARVSTKSLYSEIPKDVYDSKSVITDSMRLEQIVLRLDSILKVLNRK